MEKAKFLNDISIHEIINIYDYQLDKKLIEYARNETHTQARTKHEMQVKCGTWLNMIGGHVAKPDFKWEEEVKDYSFLLNDQLKLNFS